MRDLYKLDVDLEGRVTLDGSPVEAKPVGQPVILPSGNSTLEEEDMMKQDPVAFDEQEAINSEYAEFHRPDRANAYVFGNDTVGGSITYKAIQYYEVIPF